MNKYVTEFGLDYDPFALGVPAKVFFEGGERRLLVEETIQLLHEGSMLIAVTGPLGSGKTTIAREVRRCLGTDAVCISIASTLFMNQAQFLDAVGGQLPKHKHIAASPSIESGIARLKQYSAELDLEAQSLVLLVDDAHELSAEVLELIESLVRRSGKSFVRVMLFGERALNNLLQNTLTDEFQANLVHFELDGFTTEDTLEYLQTKLGAAGLSTPLPFSGRVIGEIQNSSNGIPATINALAADFLLSGAVMETADQDSDTDDLPEANNYSFDAQDHMQFDLDMPDVEEPAILALSPKDSNLRPVWMDFVAGYRYQLAAASLAVVLLITLLFGTNGSPPEIDSMRMATAPDAGNVNRIQLTPPLTATATKIVDSPINLQSEVAVEPVSDAAAPEQVASSPAVPNEPVAAVSNITRSSETSIAAVSESQPATVSQQAPVPKATPAAVPAPAAPASSAISGLSAYEQQLLQYAPTSYAIQILGSRSEANVQKFIAGKPISEPHGYYETRHENKPWFVVVAGNYQDRSAASAVLAKLPQSLRDMQPWIRSIAEIQRDIRQQNKL